MTPAPDEPAPLDDSADDGPADDDGASGATTTATAPATPSDGAAPDGAASTPTPTQPPDSPDSPAATEGADDADLTHDELATKVGRGGMWTLLGTVVGQLPRLVQALILPVFLSPQQYGLWAIVYSVAFIALNLRDLSLGLKYVQDRERSRTDAFNVAFTLEVGLGVLGFTIIAVAAPILGGLYGQPELFWLTLAMAPVSFIGVAALPDYVLTRDLRYGARTVRGMVQTFVSVGVTLGAAAAGWGVWAIIAGSYAQMLMLVLTLWPVVRIRPRFVRDRPAFRAYLDFGWPLWAASLCLAAFYLIIVNLLEPLFGITVAGYFQRVWSFVEMSYMLNLQVTAMLFPAIVRIGTDTALLRRTFVLVNRLMMSITGGAGFALAFLGPQLVLLWGAKWAGFGTMAQAVGLFFVFGTLAFDWENYYRAAGRTMPLFLISALLLAFLPGFIVLVLWLGMRGIDLAIVLTGIYLYVIRSYYARKMLGKVSALVATWRQLLSGVIAGGLGMLVANLLGAGLTGGLVGAAVFCAIYGVLMLALEHRMAAFVLRAVRGQPTGGLRALVGD